jgi:hypothetical protein
MMEKLPGRGATIYVHDGAVTSGANVSRVFGLEDPVKERIIKKLAATGSVVRTDTAHPQTGAVEWCAFASQAATKEKERLAKLFMRGAPLLTLPAQAAMSPRAVI